MLILKITKIDNLSDFNTLEKGWNDLLNRCNHTVFSQWEWISTWWKHFGIDKKLVVLIASENEEIIGIAPLMCSNQNMFGLRRGKLSFIGTPNADYNDFLTIADKTENCLISFLNYLQKIPEKWNYIELNEVPETSMSIPTLNNLSKTLTLFPRCPYKPLPESHDEFLGSLGSNFRHCLKRYTKKTEKQFHMDFVDYSEVQSCKDGMNILYELHQKRWTSQGLPGAFADMSFRDFHIDVAKVFAQNRQLGLYVLKLDGVPVAAIYGFKGQRKFYQYLSGFDPDYYNYGVGNQINLYAIDKCIENGLVEFDFMRGGEAYKDRWKTLSRWNRVAIIPKRGFFNNAQYLFFSKLWDVRKQARNFFRSKTTENV